MDEHLTDLVGRVGVFALLGVGAMDQELSVAAFDDGPGVRLDLLHHSQDLGYLCVKCSLGAEKDVSVRMGGVVSVVHQLGVGADLSVVAYRSA